MARSFDPHRPYLALETSCSMGTVAVGRGGHVIARAVMDGQVRHAAELVPRIAQTLQRAGVSRDELAGVVVGGGPGSFTGVRVAAATGKGIAHALDLPMWAFSSLKAAAVTDRVAVRAAEDDPIRYVLFDARGDRFYAACYRLGIGSVEELVPPHSSTVGELLEETLPPGACLVGEGALRHRPALESRGLRVLPAPAGLPTADALLQLLALEPGTPSVERPDRWEPEYVKASNAERARAG